MLPLDVYIKSQYRPLGQEMFLPAAAFHDDIVITCVSVQVRQFYRYGAKTERVSM